MGASLSFMHSGDFYPENTHGSSVMRFLKEKQAGIKNSFGKFSNKISTGVNYINPFQYTQTNKHRQAESTFMYSNLNAQWQKSHIMDLNSMYQFLPQNTQNYHGLTQNIGLNKNMDKKFVGLNQSPASNNSEKMLEGLKNIKIENPRERDQFTEFYKEQPQIPEFNKKSLNIDVDLFSTNLNKTKQGSYNEPFLREKLENAVNLK